MWINAFETEAAGARGRTFWEPIRTTAPQTARPYCCYLSTVIFYKVPRALTPDGREFERWDTVESAWNLLGERYTDEDLGWSSLAPFVLHNGVVYELGGGSVVWRNGRWFHEWLAWRLDPEKTSANRVDPEDARDAWRLAEAWKTHKKNWKLHYTYATNHRDGRRLVVGDLLRGGR
jgi:hypothetical protein